MFPVPVQVAPPVALDTLLVALVALAVTVFVGRIVLNLAWKLLVVAIVVVGIAYAVGVVV